ncbi:MAG: hypothetical protein FJ088_13275, partial [Deltaproteobacteria bacterium]|nr:hypothetical protein [Deltaproteobacteria bacterium]
MIDFDSALKFVLENSGRTKACSVAVKDCAGHFLAEGVKARCDLPRFSSSAMDGYCVKICDTQNASAEKPVRLKIQSKVNAGFKADIALKKGGAFYISTGAKMPDGVDAVVRKEDVETDGDFIAVKKQASKADNIRFKGEEYKKGDIVAEKGSLITPALAGLFVSFGLKRVRVYKKPVVSLIATGSELVPSGKKLM